MENGVKLKIVKSKLFWGFEILKLSFCVFYPYPYVKLSLVILSFSFNFQVSGIEAFSERAVHVEPPVADEVVLVEDGSIGTEEAVLGEAALPIAGTNVESLALGFSVSIVTSISLQEYYISKAPFESYKLPFFTCHLFLPVRRIRNLFQELQQRLDNHRRRHRE